MLTCTRPSHRRNWQCHQPRFPQKSCQKTILLTRPRQRPQRKGLLEIIGKVVVEKREENFDKRFVLLIIFVHRFLNFCWNYIFYTQSDAFYSQLHIKKQLTSRMCSSKGRKEVKRRLRKKILKLLLKLLRESLETLSLLGWKVGEEVLTSGQQGLVHVPSHPGIADATVVQVVQVECTPLLSLPRWTTLPGARRST